MNAYVVGTKSFVGSYNIEKLFKNYFDVKDLAKIIWKIINFEKEFKIEFEKPFIYDVQKRIPDTSKARKLLNFSAKTTFSKFLDIIITWIKEKICFNEI